MRLCVARTRKGELCPIEALPGKAVCHVHNPDGAFAAQHPQFRAKVTAELDRLAQQGVLKAREAAVQQSLDLDAPPAVLPYSAEILPAGHTVVYTDGACRGNPGPGGWAWATRDGRRDSGGEGYTTNQRMEMTAALRALTSIEGPVLVVSDSQYVVRCFQQRWFHRWMSNGWLVKSAGGGRQPVKNRDLWEPLITQATLRPVGFTWVKGHAGDPMNELVDAMAVSAVPYVLV